MGRKELDDLWVELVQGNKLTQVENRSCHSSTFDNVFMSALLENENGTINAFAMIVDINGFAQMVAKSDGNLIAQFTRDVLAGGIASVERQNGEIVGLMGDAYYALLQNERDVFHACVGIARDLDRQCQYISADPGYFSFCPGGPGLKIGIEYGTLDISWVSTRYLRKQKVFIGNAVNFASRIMDGGKGNRCLFGPKAHEAGLGNWTHQGPFSVKGKKGEGYFTYFELNLDDIWRAGKNTETYWG